MSALAKRLNELTADVEEALPKLEQIKVQRDALLSAAKALLADNPYSPSITQIQALERAVRMKAPA